MNGPFGIDHPLICVRDLDEAADRLANLGFVVTPRGRHPWGTHNRLALFEGSLLELMTIGDPGAVDVNTVDHGLFGTAIRAYTARHGEGVAMIALQATDLTRDAAAAAARGLAVDGIIDFRRPVTLPDGTRDEAVVRLAMLLDQGAPQLSAFLCQQMKRGLVQVPEWTAHANGAAALAGIGILDAPEGRADRRATALWGVPVAPGRWRSAGGMVEIVDPTGFAARYGAPPSPALIARAPAIGAVTVETRDLASAARFARAACPDATTADGRVLLPAHYLGDTVIEFVGD